MNRGFAIELAWTFMAISRHFCKIHPGFEAPELNFPSLLASGLPLGEALSSTAFTVGEKIVKAVKATRHNSLPNTNLGVILLLAPLCACSKDPITHSELADVLQNLSVSDAVLAYEAIRLAQPKGLGNVENQDVSDVPTVTLFEAMKLAANRDSIANQYETTFHDIFELGLPAIQQATVHGGGLEDALVWCQLRFLAELPDSLIARKAGMTVAVAVQNRAAAVLAKLTSPAGLIDNPSVQEFDRWLCEARSIRNPGTTGDLTIASLFLALNHGSISIDKLAWATK